MTKKTFTKIDHLTRFLLDMIVLAVMEVLIALTVMLEELLGALTYYITTLNDLCTDAEIYLKGNIKGIIDGK